MTEPAIAFRAETAEDDAFIRSLFAAMKKEAFTQANLPPEMLDPLVDMQVSIYRNGLRAQFPDADRQVVTDAEGRRLGYVAVARNSDGVHLAQFLIEPSRRGGGIGTAVLKRLLDDARAADQPLSLSVAPTNPAIRLYRRLGFVETGIDGATIAMRASPHILG